MKFLCEKCDYCNNNLRLFSFFDNRSGCEFAPHCTQTNNSNVEENAKKKSNENKTKKIMK